MGQSKGVKKVLKALVDDSGGYSAIPVSKPQRQHDPLAEEARTRARALRYIVVVDRYMLADLMGHADGLDNIADVLEQRNQRIEELTTALQRAREDMADWGAYASGYFQEKWDLTGDLAAIDAVLAGQKPREHTPKEEQS